MLTIASLPKRFLKDEEGATLLEYGMLTLLIAAVSVAVITTIGTRIQAGFQQVADAID